MRIWMIMASVATLTSSILSGGTGLQAKAPASGISRDVLPDNVSPIAYRLTLHPDAATMTFSASVRIDLTVRRTSRRIELNAKQLECDHARLDDVTLRDVTLEPDRERMIIHLPHAIQRGQHRLVIDYHGKIGRGTLGFFAMDSRSPAGDQKRTLATNFEPASERMLMPSWDEPDRKARFELTVDAPSGQMAVSNMPIASETALADGLKRVRFLPSPPMSTYLFFVAIGDYERLSKRVDGVDVGIVVAKGEADRGRFALDEAARLLVYYNRYFGIRYPLPKLDLIVAPGRIQGGSMENWGSILYSAEHILVDPKQSTEADRQLVFLVIAHEMAHQWFGDLVTMRWWDNLWLNEGFARWMQTKAADDVHPEWETGLQASWITEQGMRADAKPSTHAVEQPIRSPAEAELMFDEITYDKGASIVSMIENYIGPDRFRAGLHNYLQAHVYGNTTSSDLWRALQSSAGKPVQNVAADFTLRAGLPLIDVSAQPGGGPASIAQSRFEADRWASQARGDVPWHIPLAMDVGSASSAYQLLATARASVDGPAEGEPLIVNAGRRSYARVRYDQQAFEKLLARFDTGHPQDQITLIQDSWALAQSGDAPVSRVLDIADRLAPDANPIVWREMIRILVAVDQSYGNSADRVAFETWAKDLLAPLLTRIGWEPRQGEVPSMALVREPLLLALGRFGDQGVIAEARRIDASPGGQGAGTLRIASMVTARAADPEMLGHMVARLKAMTDPLEKQHALEALATVADPALAEQVLELATGSDAPAGTAPNLLVAIGAEHPDLAWHFVEAHIDDPAFLPDRATRMIFLPQIPQMSSDLTTAGNLMTFASRYLPPAGLRPFEGAVTQIKFNATVREKVIPDVVRWLQTHRTALH